MKHAELVAAAARWLRRRHPIVLVDVHCSVTNEQPDAIGWTNAGFSTLVECKVSRADFQRDAAKWFRREPSYGMGYARWYCSPVGVIDRADLPPRWGLLSAVGERVRVVCEPEPIHDFNRKVEAALLVSALRRATEGWGRRIFGDVAPELVDGDPHPTTSRLLRELRQENKRLREELRNRRGEQLDALAASPSPPGVVEGGEGVG